MNDTPFLSSCTADTIREAALALKDGHLVAFPTETVYGLGADARNSLAVNRIYEVKGRPSDHPLIVHISSIEHLDKWAIDIPEYAIELARIFWPGPMTLILKRNDIVKDFITGSQDSVGLRVPSHPIALALIQEFEKISNSAIAAPSANRFGQVSPTTSSDVLDELAAYLADSDIVIDGGSSSIGIESTIIDCTGKNPTILRRGFVTIEDVKDQIGIQCHTPSDLSAVKFSGSFEKHYAPKCKVVLGNDPLIDQFSSKLAGFLALSDIQTPSGLVRMESPKSMQDFARVLYSTFRRADREGFELLVVSPPQSGGLGAAILERLSKAAQGR
jgi:L-threonylcarbamoyladenylate synthase